MKALTERNIRSGFKATGIWPVNGEKALEALKPKRRRAGVLIKLQHQGSFLQLSI
jgi:hypothetical protein